MLLCCSCKTIAHKPRYRYAASSLAQLHTHVTEVGVRQLRFNHHCSDEILHLHQLYSFTVHEESWSLDDLIIS